MEAPHNALGAAIYRFLNVRPHLMAKIVDPQKSIIVGGFVVTLKIMLQHSCHLCSPAFVVACSFLSRHTLPLYYEIMS